MHWKLVFLFLNHQTNTLQYSRYIILLAKYCGFDCFEYVFERLRIISKQDNIYLFLETKKKIVKKSREFMYKQNTSYIIILI